MITYKSIINACKAFADNHHVIKGFGNGELWQINDHDQDSAFEYPLHYMVDVPSSPGANSWVYAFRVYFVSRVEAPKDRDGNPIYFEYTSEKSAMIACAQDFLSYWVQDVNYQMTIDKSLGVTTFIDAQQDGVTGCYVDIRFVVPFDYNNCILPMDDVPAPRLLCLPVSLSLDNNVIASIASGDSYNITLKDIDGNPVVWSYNEPLKILTIQLGACDPVTMTYNGVSITSTDAGGTKTITVISESFDPVGTITINTAGQLTVTIANATIVNKSPGATWTDTVYAEGTYILPQQPYTDSDGSSQLAYYDPDTPIVCTPASPYDPSAQALFNRAEELDMFGLGVPDIVKPVINDFIVAWKQSGLWYNAKFWAIICLPTHDPFVSNIEIKSLAIAAFYAQGSTGAVTPPYNTARRAIPTFAGYTFRDTGYHLTTFVPAHMMTLNDSCRIFMTYSDEVTADTFNYGSINTASNSTTFAKKFTGNVMTGDCYSTTVGTGRISVAAASGAKGYAYINRVSTSFAEIVENGATVGSITAAAGGLPTSPEMQNTFSNAGTPQAKRNQSPIVANISVGSSMNSGHKAIIHPALSAFQSGMERIEGIHTKQLVIDGNSHTVYQLTQFAWSIQVNMTKTGWKFTNLGVTGQTITQMIADFASEVAPLYDASLDKNIFLLVEGTNEMYVNGSTVDQTIALTQDYVNLVHALGVNAKCLVKKNYTRDRPTTGPGSVTYPTQQAWDLAVNELNDRIELGETGADAYTEVDDTHFRRRDGVDNSGNPFPNDAAYTAFLLTLRQDTTQFETDQEHLTALGYKTEADIDTVTILLQ